MEVIQDYLVHIPGSHLDCVEPNGGAKPLQGLRFLYLVKIETYGQLLHAHVYTVLLPLPLCIRLALPFGCLCGCKG